MKTIFVLIGLISLCMAQTSLENLQQVMNGFFTQAGLAAPTQAINCFDESDATTALTFVSTVLTQFSNDDLFSIAGTLDSFKDSFPSSVLTCLKSDPEMAQLETAYHITSSTFSSDPIGYVLSNLGSLSSAASTGANDDSHGDFEALGALVGKMVQNFAESQTDDLFFSGDALTDLQEMLDGFFTQAGLAAPTQAINCFDESDATTALNFVSTVLTQFSNDDLFSIAGTFDSFKSSFPSSVLTCLENDPEMTQLATAYHITSSTFSSDPVGYVLSNLGSLSSSASTGAHDDSQGNFEALGALVGKMVQQYASQQ